MRVRRQPQLRWELYQTLRGTACRPGYVRVQPYVGREYQRQLEPADRGIQASSVRLHATVGERRNPSPTILLAGNTNEIRTRPASTCFGVFEVY